MQLFGSFHDACLREIYLAIRITSKRTCPCEWIGEPRLLMLFQRQFRAPPRCERSLQNVCERLSSD
jgi:hypothetical protein